MRTLLSPKTALWICRILSCGFAAVFLLITVRTAKENLLAGGTLILFSALCFLLVSLLRRLIGAKRPYQEKEGVPLRHGKNDSFPSRHAYSAFFIATLAFRLSAAISYCLFPAAILLSFLRVFARVHYPCDVVAGAFLGVLAATIVLIV
jgi:membrane-associated phospholipid phosphatase